MRRISAVAARRSGHTGSRHRDRQASRNQEAEVPPSSPTSASHEPRAVTMPARSSQPTGGRRCDAPSSRNLLRRDAHRQRRCPRGWLGHGSSFTLRCRLRRASTGGPPLPRDHDRDRRAAPQDLRRHAAIVAEVQRLRHEHAVTYRRFAAVGDLRSCASTSTGEGRAVSGVTPLRMVQTLVVRAAEYRAGEGDEAQLHARSTPAQPRTDCSSEPNCDGGGRPMVDAVICDIWSNCQP